LSTFPRAAKLSAGKIDRRMLCSPGSRAVLRSPWSRAATGCASSSGAALSAQLGALLSPEGDAALGELGRRLAPHTGRIALRVVGHTDEALPRPWGPLADNESLALARALAAARRLADAAGQPLESIAAAAAGADRAPFPNTSAQANRTVTIEIVPAPSVPR
jgi:flagellar motor protein MotB